MTYDEIKSGLETIGNTISLFNRKTIHNPNTRYNNIPKIIPANCPDFIPLFISFDIVDIVTNEQNKTILVYSSYLDMQIVGDKPHLDEYTLTFTLNTNISAQDKEHINTCVQHVNDPIFIPYKTLVFHNQEMTLIPITFLYDGPYIFSVQKDNSTYESTYKTHLFGPKRNLEIRINPSTFFDISPEMRLRKPPDLIYTNMNIRVVPTLRVITSLTVANLLLKKVRLRDPSTWKKSLTDINQLVIPNTLKTKPFDGVNYNLSRQLILEKATLSQSNYIFLKYQIDAFSNIDFKPVSKM